MGLAQDVLPIDNRFGPLDLPFEVDCCMFFNILLIKSLSREMGDRSDAAIAMSAMTFLSGPISLALSGNRSSHQCKDCKSGDQTQGRVQCPN